MSDTSFLYKKFAPLWSSGRAARRVFKDVVAAYSEPHRRYHTVFHLVECVRELEGVPCRNRSDVLLAIFFHDFVHNVRDPKYNEIESAQALQRYADLHGLAPPWPRHLAHVLGYIIGTKHDRPAGVSCSTFDSDLVLDVDLAILGQPPSRFDEYETQIRAEYAHVPDDVFRAARTSILERFLGAPAIYRTEFFRLKYEKAARANVARSLARLRS